MYPGFSKLIKAANLRVARMDDVDAKNGFARPFDISIIETLRTAEAALKAALIHGSPDLAADAYVYLQRAIEDMEAGS